MEQSLKKQDTEKKGAERQGKSTDHKVAEETGHEKHGLSFTGNLKRDQNIPLGHNSPKQHYWLG